MRHYLWRLLDTVLIIALGGISIWIFTGVCCFGVTYIYETICWIRWAEYSLSFIIFVYGLLRFYQLLKGGK